MPNILAKVPEGVFNEEQISKIVTGITSAASAAESIPDDPRKQALTWVVVEEIKSGRVFSGGKNVVPDMIPVIVKFYPPEGVLDKERRQTAAEKIHQAFVSSVPKNMQQRIMTSCIIREVPDGDWGANGNILMLGDFAKMSGYEHLQHLVKL